MNDLTLFGFFLYGLKKADFDNIDLMFREHLIETLGSEGFSEAETQLIVEREERVELIKTMNRRITGSLVEAMKEIPFYLDSNEENCLPDQGQKNLIELNKRMNRIPMVTYLDGKYPIDALREYIATHSTM